MVTALTPGRESTRRAPQAAADLLVPSGALSARSARGSGAPPLAPRPQPPQQMPHGQTLSPSAGHRSRRVSEEARDGAGHAVSMPMSAANAAQWRGAVATPQSVSSWLKDANVEQRRALAQFLTQLGPAALTADKAAARARAVGSAGEAARSIGSAEHDLHVRPLPPHMSGHVRTAAEWGYRNDAGPTAEGGSPAATLYDLRTGKSLLPSSAKGAREAGRDGAGGGGEEEPQQVRVGRVRLKTAQVLGRGRSGSIIVMGAFEGKKAAVKVVPKQKRVGGGGAAAASALIAAREAELMDLCENENAHPNVLRLFGCEEDPTSYYLAQELCVASLQDLIGAVREPATLGGSKRQLLTRLGMWPPPLQQSSLSAPLRRLLVQLLDGLSHLHALGILHCKLRPASVLINSHGMLKLSGLGLGRVAETSKRIDSRQAARDAIATDGFDPPEVMRAVVQGDEEERPSLSTAAKQAADIFSAGVLIFWCLTAGRHPFGEEPAQRRANVLRGEASQLMLLRKLPEAQHLVTRMLAPDPNARLQAAQAKAHPAMWEDEKRLLFVRCVSDEPELTDESSHFVAALEECGHGIFGTDGWGGRLHAELLQVLVAHRSYQYGSVRDLLRAVRNCDHLQGMPPEVQKLLLPRPAGIANYFLPRFPALFWTLYSLAEQHWPKRSVFEPFFEKCPTGRRVTLTATPPSDGFHYGRQR